MKKRVKLFKVIFIILIVINVTSCLDYPDYDKESTQPELILKSANGYSSDLGEFYVQKGIATVLYLQGRDSDIMSASWEIENDRQKGKQIVYTFNSINSYDIEVEALMSSGQTITKTFTVNSILDLSQKDPVKSFVVSNNNDKWQLLFLFSKERMSESDGSYYNYIGTMTNWDEKRIDSEDENYIINSDGDPKMVDDVGNYLGVNFELSEYSDEHEIAIVLDNGNWVNLSGSEYVKSDNKTKAVFYFDAEVGEIIPQGDYTEAILPGENGGMHLRFSVNDEDVTLYFHLEDTYTSKSFCKYQKENGLYSDYIQLESLSSFSDWGSYTFDSDMLRGKILDLRYGQNFNNPDNYSDNMKKSLFYSEYFNSLRLSMIKLE